MRLLLDTHVVLWWLADDPGLEPRAREAIADPSNDVLVSAASAWEIAIKRALGKLEAPSELGAALEGSGLEQLPITVGHALEAGGLPRHHDDPFDRMLIAQARLEALTIMSRDERLPRYGVSVLPA